MEKEAFMFVPGASNATELPRPPVEPLSIEMPGRNKRARKRGRLVRRDLSRRGAARQGEENVCPMYHRRLGFWPWRWSRRRGLVSGLQSPLSD